MNKSITLKKTLSINYMAYNISFVIFMLTLSFATPAFSQSSNLKSKGRLVKKDGVSAYMVRDNMSKSLKLTMLVAHKTSFSKRVVKMLGHDAVPLTFSVSTAPNTAIQFDPKKIQFIQNGKTWHADSLKLEDAVIRLNEGEPFGGLMRNGDTHQAVFILPGWFDIDAPLYVRYDDNQVDMPLVSAGGE
ncbi:MAG: hypothetical protein DWQ05_05595 [Calditrichaeota bacterium]|nr:MAG: hypothetical protein DWQ05_05595 [Calditrichota bacterium]